MADLVGEEVKRPLGTIPRVLTTVWIFLGLGLPPSLLKSLGYQYLPSIEWLARPTVPALVVGVASGGLFLWLVHRDMRGFRGRGKTKALCILGAFVLGYLTGRHIVVFNGPMILALIGGHRIELSYTVADADGDSFTGCRIPLELEALPLAYRAICGVSEDFRRSVGPGARIIVSGRGTDFGVFADSLRRP
ncbi:hypothetical protein [Ensifer sp. B1-9]|uniref:hypothetical protein n=1 Tax=Ensifer sp. B1-9 TaxID=3141455 RepID=UPI003D1AD971